MVQYLYDKRNVTFLLHWNFLTNYDVICRKLPYVLIHSSIRKREKWEEINLLETSSIDEDWLILNLHVCPRLKWQHVQAEKKRKKLLNDFSTSPIILIM